MEASFGWETTKLGDSGAKKNLKAKKAKAVSPASLTKTQWAIEGKASGTVGADTFVLEATPDFLKGVTESLSHVLYFLASVEDEDKKKKPKDIFTWDWMPPKIAIAAERELKENPQNNLLDVEYKFALKMDPLFGVKAEVDILKALIHLAANCVAPGVGGGAIKFIEYVQEVLLKSEEKDADSSLEFKAEIKLEMELVLAGELSCTKAFSSEPKAKYVKNDKIKNIGITKKKADSKAAAEISAAGKMKLSGLVKAEFRHTNSVFKVQASVGAGFSFGAGGGAPSEIILKLMLEIADGEPDFKGEVEFKGLILSLMSLATLSIDRAETGKDNLANILNGNANDLEDDDNEPEKLKEEAKASDFKEVWTIFKPKKMPFWEN